MEITTLWMIISGATGFAFFLIANFTKTLARLKVLAAAIQIAVNAFVFVTWLQGYLVSSGFARFVAFWGIVVPVIMAGITTYRVILPRVFRQSP